MFRFPLDPATVFTVPASASKPTTTEMLGVGTPMGHSPSQSNKSSPRVPTKRPHTPVSLLLVIPEPQESGVARPLTSPEMCLALIKFLLEHKTQPLWACEDITAKLWNIRSATQLSVFLQNSIDSFIHSYPSSDMEKRWAQVSLQIGLACSSRHYAGRSLQVFRALKTPLASRILCDILSRLVETVAEPGDDMQGYVTELILTLEACVEAVVLDEDPSFIKDSKLGDEDVTNLDKSMSRRTHLADSSPPAQIRPRSGTETFGFDHKKPELNRSRSVQSLNGCHQDSLNEVDSERHLLQDNANDVIPQVFWLTLSLLESDYEHEYLLALRLLEKVMERLPLDRLDCRDKVERVQSQLQWNTFSGVIPLLMKGCTNSSIYDQVNTFVLKLVYIFRKLLH